MTNPGPDAKEPATAPDTAPMEDDPRTYRVLLGLRTRIATPSVHESSVPEPRQGEPPSLDDLFPHDHIRRRKEAVEPAKTFLEILGQDPDLRNYEPEHANCILRLMEQTVLAARWYDGEIRKGKDQYSTYLRYSIAAVLATPLAALLVHHLGTLGGKAGSSGWVALPAVLAAVGAGVFGVQKLLREAYSQRFRFGAFWEARSKVKTLLTTLVSTWRGKAAEAVIEGSPLRLSPSFLTDIERTLLEAEAALDAEKQSFFKDLKLPEVDLQSLITLRSGWATFIKDAVPAPGQAEQAAAAGLQNKAAAKAVLPEIEAAIDDAEKQQVEVLRAIEAAKADPALKAMLEKRRDLILAQLADLWKKRGEKLAAAMGA